MRNHLSAAPPKTYTRPARGCIYGLPPLLNFLGVIAPRVFVDRASLRDDGLTLVSWHGWGAVQCSWLVSHRGLYSQLRYYVDAIARQSCVHLRASRASRVESKGHNAHPMTVSSPALPGRRTRGQFQERVARLSRSIGTTL
jgi:hypothetical protein